MLLNKHVDDKTGIVITFPILCCLYIIICCFITNGTSATLTLNGGILNEAKNVQINVKKLDTTTVDTHPNGELIFDCELILPPSSITPIEIHNLNNTFRQQIDFGIIQVHVGYRGGNISLAYNRTLVPTYYQTGAHLGLIIYGKNTDDEDGPNGSHDIETVYIHNGPATDSNETNASNSNSHIANNGTIVMIAYVVYYRDNKVPVPGGCNLEYSMVQDAPVIIVQQCDVLFHLDTPLASAPAKNQSHYLSSSGLGTAVAVPSMCDTNATKDLVYENRYMYLPSDVTLSTMSSHDYFNYFRSMLTAEDAQKNGKLASSQKIPLNRQSFLTIPGCNVLFVTIVRAASNDKNNPNTNPMAAYVPTLYSYNDFNARSQTIWYHSRLCWIIVATVLLLIGSIKGFVNNPNIPTAIHLQFIFINIFVCSVLILAIVYMIISNQPAASSMRPMNGTLTANAHLINLTTIVPLAFVMSIVIFVCCGCGGGCNRTSALDTAIEPFQQAVQYISLQITVVFFITSFIIYYSSADSMACTLEMYGIYWIFTTASIMIIMPSLLGWYWNELILNAMWGSFLLTMAIAIYIQNPLQIICVYAIRFVMDTPDYRAAMTPPFGVEEFLLFAIWKILAIVGAIVQHRQYKNIQQTQWFARNRPSSPRHTGNTDDLERTEKTFVLQMRPNEQTPLLRRERLIH